MGSRIANLVALCCLHTRNLSDLDKGFQQDASQIHVIYLRLMVPNPTPGPVRYKIRPPLQGNHRIIPRRSLLARFLRCLRTYDASTDSIQIGGVPDCEHQV